MLSTVHWDAKSVDHGEVVHTTWMVSLPWNAGKEGSEGVRQIVQGTLSVVPIGFGRWTGTRNAGSFFGRDPCRPKNMGARLPPVSIFQNMFTPSYHPWLQLTDGSGTFRVHLSTVWPVRKDWDQMIAGMRCSSNVNSKWYIPHSASDCCFPSQLSYISESSAGNTLPCRELCRLLIDACISHHAHAAQVIQ